MNSVHGLLRSRTAAAHARVDAAFARFEIGAPSGYRRLLLAHAAVLPALEAGLGATGGLPNWRPRVALLAADLAALGAALPTDANAATAPLQEAQALGSLYVIEGSRLGGGVLAGRVGHGLPVAYLGAVHERGEWRALLAAIAARAETEDPAFVEGVIDGALAAFARYEAAAAQAEVPAAE